MTLRSGQNDPAAGKADTAVSEGWPALMASGESPKAWDVPKGQAGISDRDAARFLQQAQFSSSPAAIATVQDRGFDGYLAREFRRRRSQRGVDWLTENGFGKVTAKGEYFWPQFGDYMAWNQMLTGEDELRKRMAFALSEFFVVSLDPIDGFWPPYMIAAYWDLLCAHAFGNFRDLMEAITLNAAMGLYLNTKGNLKEDDDTGRRPDENYAREIMQLFSIGLYELNEDGTPVLDDKGAPIETYTQDDITNLARVFTGYDYNYSRVTHQNVDWLDYPVPDKMFCTDPMYFDPRKHSNLAVDFLGVHIPAGTGGQEALRIAHDTLFEHHNTGPFFARQMIQRLVTSDPSPDYVRRVARAFADNGEGVRGDLKAVWRAILLDEEARRAPLLDKGRGGKLREPVVRFAQWARTVGVSSDDGKPVYLFQTARSDEALGQSPLRSPSVFNYFRPGYVPPQTAMAKADMAAPEFQIHNESSTAGYINFLQWAVHGGTENMRPTYEEVIHLAHDGAAVIDWLDLHLTAGQLSPEARLTIAEALAAMPVPENAPRTAKRDRLAAASLMVMAAPDYIVQK